jgi:hypothetical protein
MQLEIPSLSIDPTIGDTYTILQSDSVSGQFNNVGETIDVLGPDDTTLFTFNIAYRPDSVLLYFGTIIPEPSTWALVALALVPLFLRRRR